MVPAGNGLIGVYDGNGSGGVTDLAHIQSGQSWGLDICAAGLAKGWVRFHGEIPDDASDVRLVHRDGSSTAPMLGENHWAHESAIGPVEALPVALELFSAGSLRRVVLEVPDDLAETRCHGD